MMRAVDQQLAALGTMSPAQLRAHVAAEPWPDGYGPDLLRLSIAYRLQEREGGVLPSSVAREIAAGLRGGGKGAPATPTRAGTQLVREWQGRTYTVDVIANGFTYRDRHYHSLSAIAREITGTAWSGPRFFGLMAKA